MVERKQIESAVIIFAAGALVAYAFLTFELGKKDAEIMEKQLDVEISERQVELFRDLSDKRYNEARRLEDRLNERIKKELINANDYPTKQGFWFSQILTFIGEYEEGRMTKEEAEKDVGWVLQDNWFDADIYLANEGLFRRNPGWFQNVYGIVLDFRAAEINETTARERISEVVNGGNEKKFSIIKDGAWFSYMSGSKECSWAGFLDVEYPYEEYLYGGLSYEELKQIFSWLLYDYWFDNNPVAANKILKNDDFFKKILSIFASHHNEEITDYEAREQVYALVQTIEEEEENNDIRRPLSHGLWFQELVTFGEEYNWGRFSEENASKFVLYILTDEWFGGDTSKGDEFNAYNPDWFKDIFKIVFEHRTAGISEADARERVQRLVNEGEQEELTILKNGAWFNKMTDIVKEYRVGSISKDEAKGKLNGIIIDTWFGRGSDDAYEILNSPTFFQGIVTIIEEYNGGTITENGAREAINNFIQIG